VQRGENPTLDSADAGVLYRVRQTRMDGGGAIWSVLAGIEIYIKIGIK
jgi:hypothetical protein